MFADARESHNRRRARMTNSQTRGFARYPWTRCVVRGAHEGIQPGVQRAQRANPRITEDRNKEPAKRATDLQKMTIAVARFTGSPNWADCDTGYAPGPVEVFMLSCAPRTLLLHAAAHLILLPLKEFRNHEHHE